jgi:hypothetical protein
VTRCLVSSVLNPLYSTGLEEGWDDGRYGVGTRLLTKPIRGEEDLHIARIAFI